MSYPLVRQWLLENTNLEPTLLEGAGFAALIAERIAAVAQSHEHAYVAALRDSPDESEILAANIAVPETWLFRYPSSFALLVELLTRRLGSGAKALRMCSLGCATGQEPYSMAMAVLHAGWTAEQVMIDAFDASGEALRIAERGRFGPASIRGELPLWVAPFLDREGATISIPASVRSLVRFVRADVLALGQDHHGPYDVVFCRNVMIYLNASARAKLLRLIGDALTVGGVLFVGHAEQFTRTESRLRPIPSPHSFALERVVPDEFTAKPATPATPPAPRQRPQPASRPTAVSPRADAAEVVAPEATLAAARDLADAGRLAEGEAMARSIIDRGGPTAPCLELLGMIRIAANDVVGARRMFEQAVYLEPQRAASLLQLALLSERAGDSRRASLLWDRARRASGYAAKEAVR